jgi:cell division protein FtsL
MQNIHIRRLFYHIRHRYMTMNNLVVLIAAAIAISWAWASIGVVQRNYALQGEVDDKRRQQKLLELETENLAFEQRYYKSSEYQALEARTRLGLADKGEKVLVLPPNSEAATTYDTTKDATVDQTQPDAEPPSELQQWVNFLFGGNRSASS